MLWSLVRLRRRRRNRTRRRTQPWSQNHDGGCAQARGSPARFEIHGLCLVSRPKTSSARTCGRSCRAKIWTCAAYPPAPQFCQLTSPLRRSWARWPGCNEGGQNGASRDRFCAFFLHGSVRHWGRNRSCKPAYLTQLAPGFGRSSALKGRANSQACAGVFLWMASRGGRRAVIFGSAVDWPTDASGIRRQLSPAADTASDRLW